MVEIELYIHNPGVDPVPRFATDAEIELAERLRHRLEARYLAPTAALERVDVGPMPPSRDEEGPPER